MAPRGMMHQGDFDDRGKVILAHVRVSSEGRHMCKSLKAYSHARSPHMYATSLRCIISDIRTSSTISPLAVLVICRSINQSSSSISIVSSSSNPLFSGLALKLALASLLSLILALLPRPVLTSSPTPTPNPTPKPRPVLAG